MSKILVFLSILALTSVTAFGQQADPAFYGVWKLDIAKSNYGGQPPPKAAQVAISSTGWVGATITAQGELTAIGVARGPDGACIPIGLPPELSCESKLTDARHLVWTLRYNDAVVQVNEVELLADNRTMKTTSKITPPEGAAFTTAGIWNKVQLPPAAKKSGKKK